jgi:hypothetical protein
MSHCEAMPLPLSGVETCDSFNWRGSSVTKVNLHFILNLHLEKDI